MAQFSVGSHVKERSGTDDFEPTVNQLSIAFSHKLQGSFSKAEAIKFLDDKDDGLFRWVRDLGSLTIEDAEVNLNSLSIQGGLVGVLSLFSPSKIPPFAFYWLQLLANKELFPSLLSAKNVNGGPLFRHLLLSFLHFISGYLKNSTEPLSMVVRTLYNGLLRVLLVVVHVFPEFLCAYHLDFCNVIPSSCLQLRNLVLSSFPKQMRLHDPFAPDLNVKRLPKMMNPPLILSNFVIPLQGSGMKGVIDTYLKSSGRFSGQGMSFDLVKYIRLTGDKGQTRYNLTVLNSLIVYLSQSATSGSGDRDILNSPSMYIIRFFTFQLDFEGQTPLFNALTNQLRFPNSHTMYLRNVIPMLFREYSSEWVKEDIAMVLVERLVANRLPPWGLLTTFVELLKNPDYNFWNYSFVTCAPENEDQFQNVSKHCRAPSFQN